MHTLTKLYNTFLLSRKLRAIFIYISETPNATTTEQIQSKQT
jgi:hypothetical protein